jgi:hypothetical protein
VVHLEVDQVVVLQDMLVNQVDQVFVVKEMQVLPVLLQVEVII